MLFYALHLPVQKSIETLDKGAKCVQSYQKKHKNDVIDVVLVSIFIFGHITPFSSVSLVFL